VGFAMTKFKEKVGAVLNDTGAATASSASETVALASPPAVDQQDIALDIGEASSITTTTALPATASSASETMALASPPDGDQEGVANDIGEASSITTTTALPATAFSASETMALASPPDGDQEGVANDIGEASSTATTIALADTAFAHGHYGRPGADAAITDIQQHHNATANVGVVAVVDSTFEFRGHLPDHDVFMEQKQGANDSADVRNQTPPRNRSDDPSFSSPSAWNLHLDPFSPTTQRGLADACNDGGPYAIVSYTR
jgi:hypothetical protein